MGPELSADGKRPFALTPRDLFRHRKSFRNGDSFDLWQVLRSYANSETGLAWPSKPTLAEDLGIHMRTVRYCLEELLERGWIEEAGVGYRNTRRYRVLIPPKESHKRRTVAHETTIRTVAQPDHHSPANGGPPVRERWPSSATQSQEDQTKLKTHQTTCDPTTAATPPDVSVAALPSDVEERPAPSSRREEAMREAIGPDDERRSIEALIAAGVHASTRNPWKATATLVRDYRLRWPDSDPAAWIQFAAFQQLTGPVKTRAAWIATHLTGYARKGWKPTNRDGSPRLWHQAILQGRYDDARRLAGLEVSYAPERAHEANLATNGAPRPSHSPRSLADILQTTAII